MSEARLAARQILYENRAFWRNPPAAFFTFAFPLIFLVIFNMLFGNEEIEVPGGRTTASTFFVPAIATFAIVNATFTNLATSIPFARDQGLLKRYRGTPLPGWAYLTARVAHAIVVTILLVGIVTAFGALLYGVDAPTNTLPGVLVALAVGGFAFCSLGLAMTAIIPNADAGPAIVNAVILPLLFISDVFIQTDQAPAWVSTLGSVFPVKHLSEALQTAFNPFHAGAGFEWGHVGIVAAWGVAGLILAIRFFSWEPRT
ncbi:MAG TPA: ABC transporter permease [Actinomycetota bacterium]